MSTELLSDFQKILDSINWNARGLVPVIAQEHANGRVLMLAWMNQEAFVQSMRLGEAVYWSRSRKCLWHKGEESGSIQKIHDIFVDCDNDTLLLSVKQQGTGACHTGASSCFFRKYSNKQWQPTETPAYKQVNQKIMDSI